MRTCLMICIDSPAYRPATFLTGVVALASGVLFGVGLLLAALIHRVRRARLSRAALKSTG
jgi:hypothetical protein